MEKGPTIFSSPNPSFNLFGSNLVQDLAHNIWYRFGTESVEQCSKILDSPPQFSVGPFGECTCASTRVDGSCATNVDVKPGRAHSRESAFSGYPFMRKCWGAGQACTYVENIVTVADPHLYTSAMMEVKVL